MKNKKHLFLLLVIINFLLLNNNIISQNYVCVGGTSTVPSHGGTLESSTISVIGGSFSMIDSYYGEITWDSSPTGSASITFLNPMWPNGKETHTYDVIKIELDSIFIVESNLGDIPVDLTKRIYGELVGNAKTARPNPAIKWSIININSAELVGESELGVGPYIDFTPNTHYDEIKNYINGNENLFIRAIYNVCDQSDMAMISFAPKLPAPTEISTTTQAPSCKGGSNGKIIISSVTYLGTTYTGTTETSITIPTMNFTITSDSPTYTIEDVVQLPLTFTYVEGEEGVDIIPDDWTITIAAVENDIEGTPKDFDTITVSEADTELAVTLDQTITPDCHDGAAEITANVSNGSGNYEYTFRNPDNPDIVQTTGILSNLIHDNTNGDYTVSVEDTEYIGCEVQSDDFTLVFPSQIEVVENVPDDPKCYDGYGTITVRAKGGTDTLQFRTTGTSWINGTAISDTNPVEYTYTPSLSDGTYNISIRDGNSWLNFILRC